MVVWDSGFTTGTNTTTLTMYPAVTSFGSSAPAKVVKTALDKLNERIEATCRTGRLALG